MKEVICICCPKGCHLSVDEENGYAVPGDEMEPQTAGFVPGYNPYGDGDDYGDSYGDYPAYCHRYMTDAGDEHVELCSFHAQLTANQSLPGLEKWTYELNDLYKEWIDLSMEKDRAAVASSQAFFTLWLEQQRIALELQEEVENVDGAWFRAFDYEDWDDWASNADAGWGAWSTLTGWIQSWIVGTLARQQQEQSLWELINSKQLQASLPSYIIRGMLER